jgi:alpha/beta superfamily hydrolase
MTRASSGISYFVTETTPSSVLLFLQDSLQAKGYRVLRYNSRGVGKSSGWASLTGVSEANDLGALLKWAIDKVEDVHSLVIAVSTLASFDAS